MKSDTIASAARRWDAARIEALRLKDERGAVRCEREEQPEPDTGYRGTAPCWKEAEWDLDMSPTKPGAWCAPCLARQELHKEYRSAVRRRGDAMRAMQSLLRGERKRLGFNERYERAETVTARGIGDGRGTP